jgi:hypothetical protein
MARETRTAHGRQRWSRILDRWWPLLPEMKPKSGWRCFWQRRPQSRTWASIPCGLEPEEGVRGCVGRQETEGKQDWTTGFLVVIRNEPARWRYREAPASNSVALAAIWAREGRGNGEGTVGSMGEWCGCRFGLEGKWGRLAEIMAVMPKKKPSEVRDEPDMRVPPVRRREGAPGNGSRKG